VVWEGITPTPTLPAGLMEPYVTYEIVITPEWENDETPASDH
jgi:hypothetical protein